MSLPSATFSFLAISHSAFWIGSDVARFAAARRFVRGVVDLAFQISDPRLVMIDQDGYKRLDRRLYLRLNLWPNGAVAGRNWRRHVRNRYRSAIWPQLRFPPRLTQIKKQPVNGSLHLSFGGLNLSTRPSRGLTSSARRQTATFSKNIQAKIVLLERKSNEQCP